MRYTAKQIREAIKPWMLPIAMLFGILFHSVIDYVAFLSPYLIFVMLLITYCRISFDNFRLDGSMLWLLIIQIVGSLGIYLAIRPLSLPIAESAFICILCPTATAAPVITGMLGGKVEKVITYSLLINVVVALTAPFMFSMMTDNADIRLAESALLIARRVMPLILGPLVIAIAMRLTVPRVQRAIADHQGLSFYIWAFSLLIIVGNCVSFIMKEPADKIPEMLAMAVIALAACLAQFYIGRRIGRRYGDAIAGGQTLGQKNTVLAVWLALTYFNPISSVGPACYIAWQNIVNSRQIYRKMKADSSHSYEGRQ